MNDLPLIGPPPVPSSPGRSVRRYGLGAALAFSLLSCTGESPSEPVDAPAAVADRQTSVQDLAVTTTGTNSLTVSWTQVPDGRGDPAWYRVKYAPSKIDWATAAVGCDPTLRGDLVGAPISCTIDDLQEDTEYEVQLMSYRMVEGFWQGAVYSNVAAGRTRKHPAVRDLSVAGATDSTLTVRWTQVDDGRGGPADYRVKYAPSPLQNWKTATDACDVAGDRIGAEASCTIGGLSAETSYDVQLMSYRVVDGVWRNAKYSNVATGETEAAETLVTTTSVQDLAVVDATSSTLGLRWTQVDDGTGQPALYRVKYAHPPLEDWANATIGCDVAGDRIGAEASCTIEGLSAETSYDVQLVSYRVVDGVWQDAEYSNVATGRTEAAETPASTTPVQDLAAVGATSSTLSLRWTQVDDGTGQPALYQVKYAHSPLQDWANATIGCDVAGDRIGAEASCTIEGLSAGTSYDVQLMSYRLVDGVWQGAEYSNVATGRTSAEAGGSEGVWIGPAEIAALPTSGAAWDNVKSTADGSCGSVDLENQDQSNNVCIMAKALVYARIGGSSYRDAVVDAIRQVVGAGTYGGRALALGRELAAYVIAADLIGLQQVEPTLDQAFRATLRVLRTTYTSGAASSLVDCHEKRPNNWGAHCGASRAAVAVYLGDTEDLERTAQVFKGYLGDRSSYAGFEYGELSWQCDPSRPVGINPVGCTRDGLSIDGVLPDDQRRGGTFTTSPPRENYVWEALQGLLAQAVILHRAGYPVWEWEDRALLRAVRWLHQVVDYPAEGDDTWQPHVVNRYYGTSFPATTPARHGKNVGWTDWTHG